MKRVIITGADGFVGANTVDCFLKNDVEVIAVDISEKPNRLKPHNKLTYINCNISNIDEFKALIPYGEYDAMVHFAWEGSAGPKRVDYNLQLQNALTTVECMKLAKEIGCKRFVAAGSIMEYEVEAAVHTQGNKPGMAYIYGMGKHIAHCICKSVAADIGIELVWPLISNAYGVGELSPRFVNTTLRKMINKEELQFTSGTQNYDFVYVTDVAKAFYLVTKLGKPFCEYMIGSGNAKQLKDFIIEMRDSCSPESELTFGDVPFTGTNMPLNIFDISDLKNDTGFVPEVSFAEGSKLTMEWLKTL